MPFSPGDRVIIASQQAINGMSSQLHAPQIAWVGETIDGYYGPESWVRLTDGRSGWVRQAYLRPWRVNLLRVTCAECDAVIRDSPVYRTDALCSDCGIACDRCGYRISEDEATSVLRGRYRDESWCETCTSRNAFECGHCEEFFARQYQHSCSCGSVCESCQESSDYCDSCEEYYCDDSDHECCGSQGYVNDYSYKPDPVFNGTGPVFLGMELEISADRHLAKDVTEKGSGLIYCKSDSSICDGFETVTHPMTYEWAVNGGYPWHMLAHLTANGADADSSCGIHVHIARDAFDGPEHRMRWALLILCNADASRAIARRDSREWAKFDHTAETIQSIGRNERGGERYRAINQNNRGTFEIRIFASSLIAEEVQAALAFVDATCEYTRAISTDDFVSGGWHFDAFAEWLWSRPDYAPLTAQIAAQGAYGIGRDKTKADRLVTAVLAPQDGSAPAPAPQGARWAESPTQQYPHGHQCGCPCGQYWDTMLNAEGYEIGWVPLSELSILPAHRVP